VFDAPNVAVPVGTVAGDQLPAVSKSPEVGLLSQVASCAGASSMQAQIATSGTKTAGRNTREVKRCQACQSGLRAMAILIIAEPWQMERISDIAGRDLTNILICLIR
jgi:hypothetical protein